MYSGVLIFFNFFFTQNQVPKNIIGIGHVRYHSKVFSILIRTTFERFKKFSAEGKTLLKILIFGLILSEHKLIYV